VYTGDTATGGSTPRRRYISISSVARLPPKEWPCAGPKTCLWDPKPKRCENP
jgi:hypothetical protein